MCDSLFTGLSRFVPQGFKNRAIKDSSLVMTYVRSFNLVSLKRLVDYTVGALKHSFFYVLCYLKFITSQLVSKAW